MNRIRYYAVRSGNGFWQPTRQMKMMGFEPIACGPDGPAAWNLAQAANERWDAARKALSVKPLSAPEIEAAADRMGFVYFIFTDRDRVKIGFSRKPLVRITDLATAFSRSPRMVVIFPGRRRDEKALHARYRAHRATGEWFRVTPQMQREILRFSAFDRLEDALREGPDREQTLNGFRALRPSSESSPDGDFAGD